MTLEDRLEGGEAEVRSTLPLAPGIEADLAAGDEGGGEARLRLPSGPELVIELTPGLHWQIERGPYYPEFGREVERLLLVGRAAAGGFEAGRLVIRPASTGIR